MARYRDIDMSARLLPVSLEAQIVPGSFAHAVYHLVGELDLSGFDAHYRNDDNGAPAHSPAMLLRAVLLAYSQGMVSSRAIERACRDNVVFIALTGDAKLPSNASKHRSGTREEFLARAGKLERAATTMLERHRCNDASPESPSESQRITTGIERLTREARKSRGWLSEHPDDRRGPKGGVRKSNLTGRAWHRCADR